MVPVTNNYSFLTTEKLLNTSVSTFYAWVEKGKIGTKAVWRAINFPQSYSTSYPT